MVALVKGFIPGCILTWIVASLVGSGGSKGGMLDIHRYEIMHHHLYWSWPLMIAAIGLAAALFLMTD
ncbi:MAG: hypothetical protein QM676_09640 [Novosphingobium sp.]